MARHINNAHAYKLDYDGNRIYEGLHLLQEDEYAACPYCKEEKTQSGDVDVCRECDVIIEGDTIVYTWKEWDQDWSNDRC